jgi:hypothetical protein
MKHQKKKKKTALGIIICCRIFMEILKEKEKAGISYVASLTPLLYILLNYQLSQKLS